MEQNRPIVSKKRYVLAFIIGTLVFVLGFAITYSVSYLEYQRIIGVQDPLSYQIFQDKLQYELFNKDVCSEDNYIKISRDLSFQGQIIGELEQKLGLDNPDILFRKKFYSLIQLEHFEFVKLINKECNKSINTILFFYSNDPKSLDNSLMLGDLLGAIYERNDERLAIYSFDINLDSDLIRSLKNYYDLEENKSVIILNEKQRFYKIKNIEEIESLLN